MAPKLVEIVAWVCEVDRCSLFLYKKDADCLYLKASTGRLAKPVSLKRKDLLLDEVFAQGRPRVFKKSLPERFKADRQHLDARLGAFTINAMVLPVKLEDMAVGVLELANKRRGSEFSKFDEALGLHISHALAKGVLSEEI